MVTTLKERLEKALSENKSLSKAGLARSCGIRPPSVSNWFDGRTKNLVGANLLRAAHYLGVSPEWLATGKPPMRPRAGEEQHLSAPDDDGSHAARLDPEIVRNTYQLLRNTYKDGKRKYKIETEPDLFAEVYERLARIKGKSPQAELISIGQIIERRWQGKEDGRENRNGGASSPHQEKGKQRANREA